MSIVVFSVAHSYSKTKVQYIKNTFNKMFITCMHIFFTRLFHIIHIIIQFIEHKYQNATPIDLSALRIDYTYTQQCTKYTQTGFSTLSPETHPIV